MIEEAKKKLPKRIHWEIPVPMLTTHPGTVLPPVSLDTSTESAGLGTGQSISTPEPVPPPDPFPYHDPETSSHHYHLQ